MSLHAPEATLRLGNPERDPTPDHRLALPALDVAVHPADRAVHVLDRVGRREGPAQGGGEAEPKHGQRLIEALAQTRCGAVLAVRFEPRGELSEHHLGRLRALALVSITHLPTHVGAAL